MDEGHVPTQPKLVVPGDDLASERPSNQEGGGYDLPDPPPQPDEQGPELEQWKTYFVIAINHEGDAHFASDVGFLEGKAFARLSTPNDGWMACTQVAKDLAEVSMTQRMLMSLQMLGSAMAQQQQNQAILRDVQGMPPNMNRAQRRQR